MQNNIVFWGVIALQIAGAGALSHFYAVQQANSTYESNQGANAELAKAEAAQVQVQVQAPSTPAIDTSQSAATIVGPIAANKELEESDIDMTPLMIAAGKGDELEVARLLGEGASVSVQTKSGNTALLLAAGSGHVFCVRQLINAGANPKQFNNEGDNALSLARQRGHDSVVQLLSN